MLYRWMAFSLSPSLSFSTPIQIQRSNGKIPISIPGKINSIKVGRELPTNEISEQNSFEALFQKVSHSLEQRQKTVFSFDTVSLIHI